MTELQFFAKDGSEISFLAIPRRKCLQGVDKFVEVEVGVYHEFGGDSVSAGLFCGEMEEELGSSYERPVDIGPKALSRPLISDLKQTGKLRKALDKLDFNKNEVLASALERIKTLKSKIGKDVPILTWVSAPFRSLCMLRGVENIYIDMHENPDYIKALQRDLIDLWLTWGETCIQAGADIIWSSNPTASGTCISRNHYEEFVHPYSSKLFMAYREKGYPIFFHPCGDWTDRFDLICREGHHVLHLDDVDLADFKRNWGKKMGIWGNVKSVDILMLGDPESVREESFECMRKASAGGGFILGANCDIPRDTPPENVHAMVKAAGDWDGQQNFQIET